MRGRVRHAPWRGSRAPLAGSGCLGAEVQFVATKKERLRTVFYLLRLRPECRYNKEVFQGRFRGSRAAFPGAVARCLGACRGEVLRGDVLRETGTAGLGLCKIASMQACCASL